MDSTNKNIKDNLPAELHRDETEHPEIEELQETSSLTHVRESVIKYFPSESDLSKNDKRKTESVTNSKSLDSPDSSENKKKLIENLSEKEITHVKESSESEEILQKSKLVPRDALSPMKRKSPQIEEVKIKREQSTDNIVKRNDEILSCSLNVQGDVLHIEPSGKPEKRLSATVSVDKTTGIEQNVAENQPDHSGIKCKITEEIGKTDSADKNNSEASNIFKSSEQTPSEKDLLQQQEMNATQRSPHRRLKSITVEDRENNPELVQKQNLELISHQRQSLITPEYDKEILPKSLKYKGSKVKMDNSGKDIEGNLRVEKLERYETEDSKIKTCPETDPVIDIPVRSAVKRRSELCFEREPKRNTGNEEQESDENSSELGPEIPTEDYGDFPFDEPKLKKVVKDYVHATSRDIQTISEFEYNLILNVLKKMVFEKPTLLDDYPENNEQTENADEKFEDSKILLMDEEMLKEKEKSPEDDQSGTSRVSENKISSAIEGEKPSGVKEKDHDDGVFKKPEPPKKNRRTLVKSHNKSSPCRNESNSPSTSLFEGLGARLSAAYLAFQVGPYQPPASQAGPYQPPASQAGPYQPPASQAGPYQRPASQAGPYQRPASQAGPYQRPASQAGPSQRPASQAGPSQPQ